MPASLATNASRGGQRETDLVGRFGGDEFVIVLDGLHDDEDLAQVLQRIHATVEQSFPIAGGKPVHVGMSLGLCLYPQDADEADQLLRCADAALYASCVFQRSWTLISV